MRVILALCTLFALSCAFVPDTEYRYLYEGRLGIGFPEIRNKFSGVGIKAVVTVQVTNNRNAIVKLSDIQVGEYVGDIGVKITNPLPIEYTPLVGEAKILEEPFQLFFDTNKDEVLVVPKSDIEWVVNIRKSIAQLFLIEPIRGNFGFSKVLNSMNYSVDAFSLYEPTIYGTCSVDYAFMPVGFSTIDNNKNIDVITNSDEQYYHLTRTINFDKCKDMVYIKKSNIDHRFESEKTLNGNTMSRSSVMNVKLVGKPGHFVVQESNVNGYRSLKPFSVATEALTYITNQTIVLQTTNKISKPLVVPTPNRIVKTMFTEFSSPFAAPVNQIPFVNYYNEENPFSVKSSYLRFATGIKFSPEYSLKYQKYFDGILEEVARLTVTVGTTSFTEGHKPLTTDEAHIVTLLENAAKITYYINQKDLEFLFNKYFNDKTEHSQLKLNLFIDVCTANGYHPWKVIVNEMKKGRITPERITSIFSTFGNSFVSSPLLKDILEYVKTLDFATNPIMTTNVYINFATILKKLCVVPERVYYTTEFYGAEKCDYKLITEDFVPFLKNKFETFTESYQRRTVVHALSNLGVTEAFKFVAKVATGHYDANIREIAILGLSYHHVNETLTKDEVFDFLMPIVHNTKEDAYLRQVAITILTTYKPNASWWQRLAISTWKEPSKTVASFIYHLIKGNYFNTIPEYSKSARISHFLLPLTKPFPPSSKTFYSYKKFVPELYSSILIKLAMYKDGENTFPRNIKTKLATDFGGFKINVFETMFSTHLKNDVPSNVLQKISSVIPEELKKIMQMSQNRDPEEVLAEIKKYLNPTMFTNDKLHKEMNLLLQYFNNIQFVLPLNPSVFKNEMFNIMKTLVSGQKFHLTKFFDALLWEELMPTEIGVPFLFRFSSPIFFSAEGDLKFSLGNKNEMNFFNMFNSGSFSVDLKTNFKFATKSHLTYNAILPWNKKVVTSGLESTKTVNLPINFRTRFDNQGTVKNISFDIIPTHDKQFAALHMQNVPYVTVGNVYPETFSEIKNKKIVSFNGVGTGLYQNQYVVNKEYTGLDAGIVYEGDVSYPFTWSNFYNILKNPYKLVNKIITPTSKFFTSSFLFNFGTSETKAFHPSISFTFPVFDDLNKISEKKTTGESNVFNFRLLTTGTEKRVFETNFERRILSRDSNLKRTEVFYKYTQVLPTVKPQTYCVQLETRTPVLNDYKTLLRLLTTHAMDFTVVGKVLGGTSCKDTQLATIKGSFKVSDQMTNVLVDEITNELNVNKYSTLDETEKPFYDKTNLLIEYKEPLPAFFKNATYNMYDVLRGSQYPFMYNNYYNVKNPKGRIVIEGERHMDGFYNVRAELPTENVILERFELPFIYKLKMYLFGYNLFNEFPIIGPMNHIVA